MRKIILGSKSPRRIEIMHKAGISPIVISADIDETLPKDIGMEDAVMFLSLKKSLFIEDKILKEDTSLKGSVILTADTVVYKEEILGKPENREDAFRMLSKLNGTSHFVATGVTICLAGESYKETFVSVTEVFCNKYSDSEINSYLDTDEPYDKAGSYAIQGIFGKHISHIIGDFDTVVGFPWNDVAKRLKALRII